MARKYRLTLSEDHLHAILKGTEFFERIAMGQFREILDVVDPRFKIPIKDREAAEQLFTIARRYLMPDLKHDNAYWSIHSKEIPDSARICYDFLQVVRHRLSWDRHPEGGWTVNFDTPRVTGPLDLVEIEALPQESSEASLAQSASRSTTSGTRPKSGSKSGKGKRKTAPKNPK